MQESCDTKPCVRFYLQPKFSNYLATRYSTESQPQLVSSQTSCAPPLRKTQEILKPDGSRASKCHRMGSSSGLELRWLSQSMPLCRLQTFLEWPDPFQLLSCCSRPSVSLFLVELGQRDSCCCSLGHVVWYWWTLQLLDPLVQQRHGRDSVPPYHRDDSATWQGQDVIHNQMWQNTYSGSARGCLSLIQA